MNSSADKVKSLIAPGNFWFPEAANEYARSVDFFHDIVFYVSIFLFIAVLGVALWFTVRFRRTKKNEVAKKQIVKNLKIELLWTILPFFMAMVMFYVGFRDYIKSQISPVGAMEVKVIAQKWNWVFEYPEGFKNPTELVVPLGRPIRLTMVSRDVIHSFYLPNFRLKRDVIPYRYTSLIIRPEKVGKYQVFCAEYCGEQHSTMYAVLNVVGEREYHQFVSAKKSETDIAPLELGAQIYSSYGCNACHTIDGTPSTGPSWKGLFGKKRQFSDGAEVIADENYIRSSIVSPSTDIVKGYPSSMPSFGYLDEKQIEALIGYIKSLK